MNLKEIYDTDTLEEAKELYQKECREVILECNARDNRDTNEDYCLKDFGKVFTEELAKIDPEEPSNLLNCCSSLDAETIDEIAEKARQICKERYEARKSLEQGE